jgi:hypothetical protein
MNAEPPASPRPTIAPEWLQALRVICFVLAAPGVAYGLFIAAIASFWPLGGWTLPAPATAAILSMLCFLLSWTKPAKQSQLAAAALAILTALAGLVALALMFAAGLQWVGA